MQFIVTLRILLDKLLGFFKNMDSNTFKNITIVILILLTLGFGVMWYFKDDNKGLIKRLESEATEIKNERKIIHLQIDSLVKENQKLNSDKQKIEDILNQDQDLINNYIDKANKSKQDLNNFKKQQDQIAQKIRDIRSHPANRQDDELIRSLRNHLDNRMKNK
jgi:hypothetical protein